MSCANFVKKLHLLCCFLIAAACSVSLSEMCQADEEQQKEDSVVYLDELDMSVITCGFQTAQSRRSITGEPLKIGDREFTRGVGHHSQGYMVVQLPDVSEGMSFHAAVGINASMGEKGHAQFRVLGNGRELWSSGYMTGADAAKECNVDLSGIRDLILVLDEGPEGYAYDHGDWCDAKIIVPGEQYKKDVALVNRFVDKDGNIIPDEEWGRTYYVMNRDLTAGTPENFAKTAAHIQSTILESDRDPLDIILRRTEALAAAFDANGDGTLIANEKTLLAGLQEKAKSVAVDDNAARRDLFRQVFDVQRTIALKNPLLDFNDIVFMKRHYNPEPEKEGNHMCDQFFGFHARPGGGLFILKNAFSGTPEVVDLLANATIQNGRLKGVKLDSTWGYLAPHLTYDGKQVYFAAADTKNPRHSYTWTEDNCYHIFRINIDGTNLVQLTDGAFNDIDPWLLPNGRVAFISERRGGYGRCHARPCPSYTLHSMNPDGSDIVALSVHETNEWAPTVDHNGMIVYTRWDYVDRGFNQAHHPWITFPDGRDSRAIQGNYSDLERSRPHFETNLKPIPDSNLFVATACGHHSQNFGSIITIDPTVEDDDTGTDPMAPIRRVTPEQPFPESEIGVHGPPHIYGQAYPLSEEFFLVVYDPFSGSGKGEANRYGIYLLDVFGNKTLLYRDENISCQTPYALRATDVPPIIPHQTLVGIPENEKAGKEIPDELPKTAVVGVTNVYTSARPFPEGAKIKELRIVQVLPKTTTHANVPWIGFAGENGARKVLGTVPVEEDGSARFEMPVNVPVYFQALDENGVAVQSMRSATYVHPGETLTCLGCHEGRHSTAQNTTSGNPIAFERVPSEIKPEVAGSNPFNYPTLVQNILDRHCVECHDQEAANGKTFKLDRGEAGQYFYNSYMNLRPHVFVMGNSNRNSDPNVPITWQPDFGGAWNQYTEAKTFPGKCGASRSPLWKLICDGHYDVKLSPEEKRALALWMDNNCDYFGAYELESLDAQRQGLVVTPTLE
ncbi:MAG: NPCBM/NEW2 domain-containing protein [Planctomycetia bacterium]|nr:NPCBM/NEW2 domain-containing protein [Planctomycetia bacterium]